MVQPRTPHPTVQFVDSYCQMYQHLFPEVRSFEAFKYLHVGLISDIKRKTLPAITKVVGLDNEQSLHHFLTQSPWSAKDLEQQRLEIILRVLSGREIILIIDDTGDKKQGHTTDYVKRQYIGNLVKTENGIVAVTAYAYIDGITLPLTFEVYKPKERLKKEDKYLTKPEIAAGIIRKLLGRGLKIKLVLADSLYGESCTNFIDVLYELKLQFAVAIRSNHAVLLLPGEKVRSNRWRKFERIFTDGKKETRYIREIIYGKRCDEQYWLLTTDTEKLPANSTCYLMTHISKIKYQNIGNIYGIRTWVEYGLKQSKNELGWADFRVTNYAQIEKWWELVMSAYLMVSLHSDSLNKSLLTIPHKFQSHETWDENLGWKNLLNNLRLILQPFVCFNFIKPWLEVFPIPQLSLGFPRLISIMNQFDCLRLLTELSSEFYFSSA